MSTKIKLLPRSQYLQCCVPGCMTYDLSSKFLRFPSELMWRQKWVDACPEKNFVVDRNSVICLRHFRPTDIALYTTTRDTKGRFRSVRNSKPLVKEGAVPAFFPVTRSDPSDDPDASTTATTTDPNLLPSLMFEIPARDARPQTFGDLEDVREGHDYLIDYTYFKRFFKEKLEDHFTVWNFAESAEDVTFYTLDTKCVPKVISSVKVDAVLMVVVTLEGRTMDKADLTWILPFSGRVNRWSQLDVLLTHFEKGCTQFSLL